MSPPVPILLMSYDLRFGGSERQLTETALYLDRDRFLPHVGCIRLQGGRRGDLERGGVPLAEFAFRSFGSLQVMGAARRLATYLRRHRIRLVHSFDVPGTLFAIPVAFACRIPVVLSSQRAYRELTPGVYRGLLRVTDRLADGVVVNSANLREYLRKHDHLSLERSALVYNSVDTNHFSRGEEVAEVLQGCFPVIGSTAMLRPEKGIDTLVEAFATLAKRSSNAGLLLVGEGPLRPEIEARILEAGLQDRCYLAGPQSDVLPWLRRMDVFVLPSLSEALSNSLLEAMAVGCAPIASSVGGNPELVSDGETGLLFPAGDAAALASRLQSLSDDDSLRRRLAEAAQVFVRSRFSRETAVAAMGDLYSQHLRRAGVTG